MKISTFRSKVRAIGVVLLPLPFPPQSLSRTRLPLLFEVHLLATEASTLEPNFSWNARFIRRNNLSKRRDSCVDGNDPASHYPAELLRALGTGGGRQAWGNRGCEW